MARTKMRAGKEKSRAARIERNKMFGGIPFTLKCVSAYAAWTKYRMYDKASVPNIRKNLRAGQEKQSSAARIERN